MKRMALAMMALCLAATMGVAVAQNRTRREEEDDKLPPNVPPPISTLTPVPGVAGRRLEPGAVLCRSEDDLARRAVVNQRRADGVPDPGDPLVGCHLVTQTRGVEIVARHGPGRVEVKVKPNGELGWTDAYMP